MPYTLLTVMGRVVESNQNLPSNSSSVTENDGLNLQQQQQQQQTPQNNEIFRDITNCDLLGVWVKRERKRRKTDEGSLITEFIKVLKKSLVTCTTSKIPEREEEEEEEEKERSMEIGMPMNVRHVSHVTYDCFDGFLGLPDEFEIEVSRRPPSASTRVFGVSTASMHLSFDSRGNTVPTILLLMQSRLYAQAGLQTEGIFRINPDTGQEEYAREQLNMGMVPDDVDIHCLAGLIKAWFRELPNGLLDSLPLEQVMQADSEDDYIQLVRLLPSSDAHLFHWAIDLMADVAQLQHLNKMNARNIAMVFAPNMTQMSDPMTAISFVVQLMNFLKTLIEKTLQDRQSSVLETAPSVDSMEPSDENGDHRHGASKPITSQKEEETQEIHESYDDKTVAVMTRDEKENQADHCSLENPACSNMCRDVTITNARDGGQYQSKSKKKKTRHSTPVKKKKIAALIVPLKLQSGSPKVNTGSGGA